MPPQALVPPEYKSCTYVTGTKLDKRIDELIDLVSQQSEDQAAGVSIRDLEVRRDDCLVAVLSALRANDFAAGAVVREHEERLRYPSAAPLAGRDAPMTARAALSCGGAQK